MATSQDNGATWGPNVRITDRSIDRKLGVWSNGFDIRQPPGLVSTAKVTTVAWDDTRLANAVTEGQDVFVRAAQFEAFGANSSTAVPYTIAATGGLALAGLVLLLFGRRRRPASPVLPPTDRAESLSAS